MAEDIPIVLTGTILPNAIHTAHSDPLQRCAEYLAAIRFYREFAPVWFLENSAFPLDDHSALQALDGVTLVRFPPSRGYERGKGHQEFEMLDTWVATCPQLPPRWLKITGRYLIANCKQLLKSCRQQDDVGLIIDQHGRTRSAHTSLFCVHSDYYRTHLASAYLDCDDSRGRWIEHVLYDRLRAAPASSCQLFTVEPVRTGTSGSVGVPFRVSTVRTAAKAILRLGNRIFDQKCLWY